MTMLTERLPAHPRRLPILTLLLGILAGLILLGADDTEKGFVKGLSLLGGVLPVGQDGDGWLRVLLWRMMRTLFTVSFALILGMSMALAVSVMVAGWWQWLRRLVGWIGRVLGCLPPMAWALGMLYVMVQCWELPVESMFPSRPGATDDSWWMKSGRFLWLLLAPAVTLAIPAFVLTLRACLLRVEVLWSEPMVKGLRSRGYSWSFIQHHHLTPRLWPHVVRMAWPMTLLLMAFTIPVEEVFMLKGWGGFMATALREREVNALAAGVYAAGGMMALWFFCFAILEKPLAATGRLMPMKLAISRSSWIAGTVLLLLLMFADVWFKPSGDAHQAEVFSLWKGEVSTALTLAAVALVVTVLGLSSRWLMAAMLILALLLPLKQELRLLLALALALPEWLRSRGELRRMKTADYLAASRMMGGRAPWIYFQHGWLVLRPGLVAGFFRMTAAAVMWKCGLNYYGFEVGWDEYEVSHTWGHKAYEASVLVLDAPWKALNSLVVTGLWCLCFQWFARGFGSGNLPLANGWMWWRRRDKSLP